ncbi:MAG: ornithine carbamoyltransferase [Planctomycetaceae bacterium]|jgi:ornithine carbamoyltransferase|nr:ornithine carbamoyltransferase [Planctomycetaceae bacterium]
MRHFITLNDITTNEFNHILELSASIKQEVKQGNYRHYLPNKILAMIFEKQSLRTRVSFETGMLQLGGGSIYLGSEIGFGKRESIKDIAEVLSSMVSIIMFRGMKHQSVVDLAQYSSVPVINGLTDSAHPCQALADMFTLHEIFGSLRGYKLAWIGDANNVAISLLRAAAKLGMEFSVAAPDEFQFNSSTVKNLIGENVTEGFNIELTNDPYKAVKNAIAVYTDVWVSMGQENEEEERKKILQPYQVNAKLMSAAQSNAVFLHCLPARRGLEVTDEVIDSTQSKVVQQAENRLHAQKGLLVWLLNETQLVK